MTKTSKTIVFFGNERIATGVQTTAPTLQRLIDEGYTVKAVVSNYEVGTSRKSRDLEIQKVAAKYDIPVLLPAKPSEIAEDLKSFKADIGILVAYGKIVPQSVIDIFPAGIINIHPSLLPLHRGPTPLESVILDGSTRTGVSIMKLVRAMDAGPVYAQSEVSLTGTETKQELADTLIDLGGSMLTEILPGILDRSIVALPQEESRATYDNLISKEQGVIVWTKSAQLLAREIRAYESWPQSRTKLAGKDVIIIKAHAIEGSRAAGTIIAKDKELMVYCGQGALVIDTLKPAGKNQMTAQAFLAGHKNLL